MSFYDALQLDPTALKTKIRESKQSKQKNFFRLAIFLRAILLVGFAIVFIGICSYLFGAENTPMAVVLFCILLSIRFVNFEYCIGDSLICFAASLFLLWIIPSLVTVVSPILATIIHFIVSFSLLFMTSQRPELGNGGLYSFAYIYLIGNPVTGELFIQRGILVLIGYFICAAILILKHRHAHHTTRFSQVIKKFSLFNRIHLWQLRMAIGICFVLTLGYFFQIERFIWMGFACTSLLSTYPYSEKINSRFYHRFFGILIGSAAFFILFQILPSSVHTLIGPLGGFFLGFCTNYFSKTIMNCFGALSLGATIYGLQGAVLLRIWDTMLGVLFTLLFVFLFHKLIASKMLKQTEMLSQSETSWHK